MLQVNSKPPARCLQSYCLHVVLQDDATAGACSRLIVWFVGCSDLLGNYFEAGRSGEGDRGGRNGWRGLAVREG